MPRGGPRPNSGRPLGVRNRTQWEKLLDNIAAVATRKFNRKELKRMADNDPWRFVEKIVIPFARPVATINVGGDPEMDDQLPLIFRDDPQREYAERISEEMKKRGITFDGDTLQIVDPREPQPVAVERQASDA